MSVSFCVCPGLWYPELVAPSIFISVGRQTESRHHSNRNPPSVCEKPKEHQNSPHSVLSLCLALAKSRQLLSGSARCSWVVCPILAHNTSQPQPNGRPAVWRQPSLNGSDRHIILPWMSLSNDRSREASNIHAPATNYGGGMEVSGLRDVSVCHDGPYRHCCLHTRPAASARGEYGLLAKDVPPVRVPSTETQSFPLARRPATGNDH